jgi:hypothetical protein
VVALAYSTFRRRLSLLPVLGLLINLSLMTQLGIRNWTMFFAWLLIGLVIYAGYGYKHSKLSRRRSAELGKAFGNDLGH